MQPIQIIIAAFLAGVAKITEGAVGDLYDALKRKVKEKLGSSDRNVSTIVDSFESDPEVFQPALEKILLKMDAGKDADILDAARLVLRQIETTSEGADLVKGIQNNGFLFISGENNSVIGIQYNSKDRQ